MEKDRCANLIHVAKIDIKKNDSCFLFLRKIEHYQWFKVCPSFYEETTEIISPRCEEAIRLAKKEWKEISFLNCGFIYSLPARDCVGSKALFSQMMTSYAAPNGIFFDNDTGHHCYVDNASREALDLLRALRTLP